MNFLKIEECVRHFSECCGSTQLTSGLRKLIRFRCAVKDFDYVFLSRPLT
jgi:hypothetical protein